jgi:hypothetical protein
MDFSGRVAAVLAYFPFIVAVPAGVAVVCNHIAAAKRHPKVVYTSCGLLSLCIAFLLSKPPGTTFKGVNLGVAGVLAALSFVVAYLRSTMTGKMIGLGQSSTSSSIGRQQTR